MAYQAQAALPIIDLGRALPTWRRLAERAATVALWSWWACLLKPAFMQMMALASVSWRIALQPPKAVAVARTAAAKLSMHQSAAKLSLHDAVVAEKFARAGLETYLKVAPVRDLVAGFSQVEAAAWVLAGMAFVYWVASRIGGARPGVSARDNSDATILSSGMLAAARGRKIVIVSHSSDARVSAVEDLEAYREAQRRRAPVGEELERLAS